MLINDVYTGQVATVKVPRIDPLDRASRGPVDGVFASVLGSAALLR